MSKGDELWRIRANILKRLYDEGAISEETGIRGVTLISEMVEGARGREVEEEEEQAVTKGDVEILMRWLYGDELIQGEWVAGNEPIWLTSEGFEEAHRKVGEAEDKGKDYDL